MTDSIATIALPCKNCDPKFHFAGRLIYTDETCRYCRDCGARVWLPEVPRSWNWTEHD